MSVKEWSGKTPHTQFRCPDILFSISNIGFFNQQAAVLERQRILIKLRPDAVGTEHWAP